MAEAKAVETTKPAASAANAPASEGMVIIDLGEHSRKRVKRLRRGYGRLMEKVEDTVADLEEQGVIEPSAQKVIVVVRQEFSFSSILDDDDDDDDDDD